MTVEQFSCGLARAALGYGPSWPSALAARRGA